MARFHLTIFQTNYDTHTQIMLDSLTFVIHNYTMFCKHKIIKKVFLIVVRCDKVYDISVIFRNLHTK